MLTFAYHCWNSKLNLVAGSNWICMLDNVSLVPPEIRKLINLVWFVCCHYFSTSMTTFGILINELMWRNSSPLSCFTWLLIAKIKPRQMDNNDALAKANHNSTQKSKKNTDHNNIRRRTIKKRYASLISEGFVTGDPCAQRPI